MVFHRKLQIRFVVRTGAAGQNRSKTDQLEGSKTCSELDCFLDTPLSNLSNQAFHLLTKSDRRILVFINFFQSVHTA